MTEPLLAVPYVWNQGSAEKNTKLLDHLVAHPQWVVTATTAVERRILYASILTDPNNRLWEVWRGGDFVGMLYLGEIIPGVGATLHFTFLDAELRGKATLLKQFLGRCFTEFGFHRITSYVPESIETLASYLRRKLGFRYEGESRDHPLYTKLGCENPQTWVARQGSRREQACWNDKLQKWEDVLVMRLLQSEYEASM